MPVLPLELINLVVEHTVEATRGSGDGSVLCALMHSTSWLRFKVVQAFEPLTLWEFRDPESSPKLFVQRHFVAYVWDALEHCLTDFAVKRHKKKAPKRPRFPNFIGRSPSSGACIKKLVWALWVNGSVVSHRDGTVIQAERDEVFPAVTRTVDDQEALTVSDACDTLDSALLCLDSFLRFYSPYQRAIQGSLEHPAHRLVVQVKLILPLEHCEHYEDGTRISWTFATHFQPR